MDEVVISRQLMNGLDYYGFSEEFSKYTDRRTYDERVFDIQLLVS